MALTQVNTDGVKDDAVTQDKVANDAIDLTEIKAGVDGKIISYDASGNPVAVGPGTDGQVLTSTGAGSPPAFEDVPAGGATINNATENEIVTVASNTGQLDAESALTFDGTKVVLGGQTARAIDGYQGTFQIEGTGDTTTSMSIVRNSNDNHPPSLNFGKSKGTSNGDSTTVADASNLGQITFKAADGTDMECEGARIEAISWGSQASNNTPTALQFRTNLGAATSSVVGRWSPNGNLEIEDGNLKITTAGHGIDFSATADGGGSATNSELFDDYEEGTWQPVVQGSSVTQYGQTGWYTKIGNIVHFGVYVTVSGGTANNEIHGLPYSVSTGEIYNVFSNWSYAWWDWQLTHDAGPLVVWAQAGGSVLKLKQTDWNGQSGMPDVNFGGGNTTTNLYGTGFYRHG